MFKFMRKNKARELGKKKPNFVVVGFGKCGTTSLHYALKNHPDICLVKSKEARFFDVDSEYKKGMTYYLEKHFPHYNGEKAVGDITPAYIFYERSLPRIKKSLGKDVKIIVIMRNPVIRAFSHYIHSVRISEEREKFIDQHGNIINPLYQNVSMYSQSLKNLYKVFPAKNILTLVFERDVMQNGTNVACRKIEDFLNLSHQNVESMNVEAATGYLASVTVLKQEAYIELKGEQTNFKEGDVIIEHIRKPEGYHFECRNDLSEAELMWFKGYPENITLNLDKEMVNHVYNNLYKKDAEEVAKLTGENVLEYWDNVDFSCDYQVVESRLQYPDKI